MTKDCEHRSKDPSQQSKLKKKIRRKQVVEAFSREKGKNLLFTLFKRKTLLQIREKKDSHLNRKMAKA